jgi:hypothetical protein
MDSKARPGTNFSANVNVASTKFNQNQLNNPTAAYNNQLSSSITYSKTFNSKYNLTISGNHNQDNETRLDQCLAAEYRVYGADHLSAAKQRILSARPNGMRNWG